VTAPGYTPGAVEEGTVSQQAVAEILGKALRDRLFAERLRTEPEAVLAPFELTDQERAAIIEGTRSDSGAEVLEDRPRTATRLM
jgi:hypothetical protein